MINTGTRSSVLPVVCAVVGLGVLAVTPFNTVNRLRLLGFSDEDAPVYGQLAALVLALLAWHLWPRWSWVALMVFGPLCAIPTQLFLLAPEEFEPWMEIPNLLIGSAAAPLLLVGLLGVTTAMWRAGRRRAGAVLIGATLALQPIAGHIIGAVAFGAETFVAVAGLVLIVATMVLAIGASVVGPQPVEPELRPRWQVTVAGAVAGVAPVVYHLWRQPEPGLADAPDVETGLQQAGQHLLIVGLVVLGACLLAGLVAGARVLVVGVAAGLLLGAVSELAGPAMIRVFDLPAGVPAAVAIGALAASVGLALPPARMLVGVIGLGVVVLGLAVLWAVSNAEAFANREIMLVLLVVAVIAAVALLASLSEVLVWDGAVPAALAGVAAGVAASGYGIITYFTLTASDAPTGTSGFLPVIVFLACAAGLAIFAHRRWLRGSPQPAPDPEPQLAG